MINLSVPKLLFKLFGFFWMPIFCSVSFAVAHKFMFKVNSRLIANDYLGKIDSYIQVIVRQCFAILSRAMLCSSVKRFGT